MKEQRSVWIAVRQPELPGDVRHGCCVRLPPSSEQQSQEPRVPAAIASFPIPVPDSIENATVVANAAIAGEVEADRGSRPIPDGEELF